MLSSAHYVILILVAYTALYIKKQNQLLPQGVRIGQDYNNDDKMGEYEGTYFLTANMQSAYLELKKAG